MIEIPQTIQYDRTRKMLELRGSGHTSLYADINRGLWLPPIKRGRTSLWPRHETNILNAARLAGASDEQTRDLVRRLAEARKWHVENAVNGEIERAREEVM